MDALIYPFTQLYVNQKIHILQNNSKTSMFFRKIKTSRQKNVSRLIVLKHILVLHEIIRHDRLSV